MPLGLENNRCRCRAALSELGEEAALAVEDLHPKIERVHHQQAAGGIHRQIGGIIEFAVARATAAEAERLRPPASSAATRWRRC